MLELAQPISGFSVADREAGHGGDGAERCKGLAILKIDPSEALIRHQVMSEGGPQVLFERRDNRVPNPRRVARSRRSPSSTSGRGLGRSGTIW
jgi:hypothetical protein